MKYLFICSAGEHRAPEAAKVARELAKNKGIESFVADSLGINSLKKSDIRPVVSQYDRVFVMEKWIRNRIWKATSQNTNPIVLNISDDYTKEQDKKYLRKTLQSKLSRYI